MHYFALEAMKRGHQVRIITSQVKDIPPDEEIGERIPITRLGRSVPIVGNGSVARVTFAPNLGARLQKILDRERFDVIHIHAPLTPTLPILALTRSRTVTVGTFHTNFEGNAFLGLFLMACQGYVDHLDGLIGVSKTAVGAVSRYCQGEYKVIPNGIDVEQFNPCVPRVPAFDDGRFNVLWVGRMEPRNGLDRMIKAFSLAPRGRDDMRLIVIGDGPLGATYERMVTGNLKKRVHFTGFVNAGRPALYASADVLCVPATISSFGITVLEGMAAGRPVIASRIAGFSDVMTHGKEGLLVDTGDAAAFRDAILKIAEDRALAAALARNGRATAETYSWPRVTDDILAFYAEAAHRRKERACRSA